MLRELNFVILRNHAIELYGKVINYLSFVLKDIPEEKMLEQIGEGEKPVDILFHLVATPHFWRKKAGRPFDFRAKFENLDGAIELLKRQYEDFKKILENDEEIKWEPTTSIPWIMIRSANHMMHHAAMLVYMRHIWGLPPLGQGNGWASIVDIPGSLNYASH